MTHMPLYQISPLTISRYLTQNPSDCALLMGVSILIRMSTNIASNIILKSTAFGKLFNLNPFPDRNWKTFLYYLIAYKAVEYITLFLFKYKTIKAASFVYTLSMWRQALPLLGSIFPGILPKCCHQPWQKKIDKDSFWHLEVSYISQFLSFFYISNCCFCFHSWLVQALSHSWDLISSCLFINSLLKGSSLLATFIYASFFFLQKIFFFQIPKHSTIRLFIFMIL